MKKEVKLLLGAILGTLIMANIVGYMHGRTTQKEKDAVITRLKTEKQTFELIVNGRSEMIARQEQRIITLEQAKEAGLINLKELRDKEVKNVQLVAHLRTEISKLKLEAGYTHPPEIIHDTVYVNGQISVKDYLRVPQPWDFKDKWNTIEGVITTKGVTINSLNTFAEPTFTLGYSRGFLKKSKPIILYEDKNPDLVVKDMDNIVIINNIPFYKKPWFYRFEGILGVLAAQKIAGKL